MVFISLIPVKLTIYLCSVQQNIYRNLWKEIQLFKHFYIFYNTDKYQGATLILLGVISKNWVIPQKLDGKRQERN